jgi:hypothetical protein
MLANKWLPFSVAIIALLTFRGHVLAQEITPVRQIRVTRLNVTPDITDSQVEHILQSASSLFTIRDCRF